MQNVITTIKQENKSDFYKEKDENEDDNINIKEDYHPNIIKIILWLELLLLNWRNIKLNFLKIGKKIFIYFYFILLC